MSQGANGEDTVRIDALCTDQNCGWAYIWLPTTKQTIKQYYDCVRHHRNYHGHSISVTHMRLVKPT